MRSENTDRVIDTLRRSLTDLGYTLYNPFGLIPGKAYARSVRLFVAPTRDGWVKIIGAPDEAQFPPLSADTSLLYTALDGTRADIRAYVNGSSVDLIPALTPFLRPSRTADDLQRALEATSNFIQDDSPSAGLPFDALPDNVKVMAGNVNTGQAQKMFARLSGDLMKKVAGGDQADAARALVSGGDAPDWNSSGGARIQALMTVLTVPPDWREPDFDQLRDSYQLHERRRRNPNARVYPGDDAVMNAVPDALIYTPIYGGAN
ncbi:MAG: hypothetical protein LCI00_22910 [Chloroflexi bacterium]|nr:hypothetical protein [Chloroflexota bacterium]MCC6895905.1 hypothetical protein [Anaerolineae bacterium]